MTSLLQVVDVSSSYGKTKVLHGLSVSIEPGETRALLGANGAGKTTLLRVISGLQAATSGHIYFEGEDISGLGAEATTRRGIVHVLKGRRLFKAMSVRDNLLVGQDLGRMRSDSPSMAEVLDLFPVLRGRLRQESGTLSGGEQQMVAVARALLTGPRLMLLDEPSLGLSPIAGQHLTDHLLALREFGVAVLLVEQNLRFARRLCEAADILRRGNVVERNLDIRALPEEELMGAYMGVDNG